MKLCAHATHGPTRWLGDVLLYISVNFASAPSKKTMTKILPSSDNKEFVSDSLQT
jgi:hypothetical protein